MITPEDARKMVKRQGPSEKRGEASISPLTLPLALAWVVGKYHERTEEGCGEEKKKEAWGGGEGRGGEGPGKE